MTQTRDELKNRGRELQLAQEAQVTARFTAAVEQLGDDEIDVRLGGVYALQRIMRDSARDQPAIVDVLSAYVRTHGKKRGRKPVDWPRPIEDAVAAARVLGLCDPAHDGATVVPWDGASLAWARLSDTHLSRASLAGVNLSGGDLKRADLSHAVLRESRLEGAELVDANLSEANLDDSKAQYAQLVKVDLTKASLNSADLDWANLSEAMSLALICPVPI